MGLVINPRGTSGACKTWLVREVMRAYRHDGAKSVSLRRDGRSRPMGCQLFHPHGSCPLAIVGHYEATRGGTDTIPETDGGLGEALRLTDALAASGNDVLLEGLQLSDDVEGTAALARAQRARGSALHVLCLDVPLERCVRNVVARRRAGRTARIAIQCTARTGHAALIVACEALRHTDAGVEWMSALQALNRTLALLGLSPARQDGPDGPRLDGFSHVTLAAPGPVLTAGVA